MTEGKEKDPCHQSTNKCYQKEMPVSIKVPVLSLVLGNCARAAKSMKERLKSIKKRLRKLTKNIKNLKDNSTRRKKQKKIRLTKN